MKLLEDNQTLDQCMALAKADSDCSKYITHREDTGKCQCCLDESNALTSTTNSVAEFNIYQMLTGSTNSYLVELTDPSATSTNGWAVENALTYKASECTHTADSSSG